ncbi:MAG TPA: Uma2 family endonuclease [Pseudonocardiaceae bacterium]|jgi:Uma2 family endonuclease|nr:Uma2 family endonuclease [Pseudonocardiaceae bacterium]
MAAPIHHDPSAEKTLALHEVFEPPEGYKAEVLGRQFVVSPSPSGRHGFIYDELHAQLRQLLPGSLAVANTVTLDMTATSERYMPDVLVIGKDVLNSDEWLFPAEHAELVVEIVSPSNAGHDRVTKVRGYAASGVPIYLLIDPLEQSVTLFFEPVGEMYQQVHRVPFGASLALPEPYTGKIDTSAFA